MRSKCPRCNGFVVLNQGGYHQATIGEDRDGVRGSIPVHMQCLNCGWFDELWKESVADRSIIRKNRDVGEKSTPNGEVKNLVIEHWELFVYYHDLKLSWPTIQRKMQVRYPPVGLVTSAALCNAFHRVRRQKNEHNK